jgi:hypothetical protein
VTIDYALIGGGALVALIICVLWKRLGGLNSRLKSLEAEVEELRILKSRLFLKELNARASPLQVSNSDDKSREREQPHADDRSAWQPSDPAHDQQAGRKPAD